MRHSLFLPNPVRASLYVRSRLWRHESGAADVADPLGCSYLVEELCRELEAKAREYWAEIEKRGGMIACIEAGYVQREVQEAAYRTQLRDGPGRTASDRRELLSE